MSRSSASCEAVVELLSRYYDETMPLYFSDGHVQLLQQLLLDLSPTASLKATTTQVLTVEPIVYRSPTDLIAIISIPLIGQLVQHTVEMPADNLEFVIGGINLLSDARVKATSSTTGRRRRDGDYDDNDDAADDDDTTDDTSCSGSEELDEVHIDEATEDYQPIQRNAVLVVRKMADLNRDQRYRMVQLMRLVLVAIHFWEHYNRDVPFDGPHEPFADLIVRAERSHRRASRKRRRIQN